MSFLFIDIHRKLHECNPAHEELCFHEADDKGRRPGKHAESTPGSRIILKNNLQGGSSQR